MAMKQKGIKGKAKGMTRREFIKGTATVAAAATVGSLGFPTILGAAAPEILIGHIHPLSGPLAFDGQEMKNAVAWGVKEVNDAGGIKSLGGAKLKLIDADSEGKPEKSISEVERLDRAGVVAITGCYQSAVTIVATQSSEKVGIPFVVGVASANEITARGFKYTFRVQPPSRTFSENALKFLSEIAKSTGVDAKTIAYLHENTQFGTTLADDVEKLMAQYGMKVISRVSYSTKAADYSTEVGKIKAAGADLIFTTGYFGDGVRVVRTLNNLRVKAKAIVGVASGGLSHKKFVAELGDMTESVMDCNYFYNPRSERAKKTLEGFKAAFGGDMSPSMVYGYQPVSVIADAIERAKSTNREAIRKALTEANFANHILPQAPIVFDATGQNKNASAVLMQVANKNIQVVWPTEYAMGKVLFPRKG